MPTHDSEHGPLMIKTPDGDLHPIGSIPEIQAMDLGDPDGDTSVCGLWICGDDAVELCGTLRLPSEIRKRMSRKRYKKILMSFGFSRNDAEKISRVTLRILTPASRSIVITSLLFSGARKEMGIRNEQAP